METIDQNSQVSYYLNELGQKVNEKDLDLSKGYIEWKRILKQHHDIIPMVPAKTHAEIQTVYFSNGTNYIPKGNQDKNIEVIDSQQGIFDYIGPLDNDVFIQGIDVLQVTDKPQQNEQPAWDEYDFVGQYHLFTPEELQKRAKAQQQQNFITTGENRLSNNEQAVNDLTLSMAEMLGV